MATAGTIAPSAGAARNLFAADLVKTISGPHTQENVVYSPASVHAALTFAMMAARGETENEMRKVLKLGVQDRTEIAKDYSIFLKKNFQASEDGPQLQMANRWYVNDQIQLSPDFMRIGKDYFNSVSEALNFDDAPLAVKSVNAWVEQQTNSKIKNLLTPDSINKETTSLLVNVIYFKAKWAQQFSLSSTHKAEFNISPTQKTSVDMMFSNEDYRYADLPELDATAVELPYENSDLSMLIILPNQVDGLAALEKKIATIDLNEISSRLELEDVEVMIPRFKIEYDLDMKEPLQQLGMQAAFSNGANFEGLTTNSEIPQKISDVKHKAFLDVNEAGSEAAAATFLKIVPMSLNLQQKTFRADHPFIFAIRNRNAVFFAGHVAKL